MRAELNLASVDEPTSSSMLFFLEYRPAGLDPHLLCGRRNGGALDSSEAIE
jgi:hypothetical protein